MSPDFMQRNEQTKKMKAFFLGGVHPVTWDSVEAMDSKCATREGFGNYS